MRKSNKEKTTGSKGFEPSMVQGLARCGGRGGAGAASPSSSDCSRCERRGGAGVFTSLVGDCSKIATWNVRSLYVSGNLANVLSEMKRMGIDIMGDWEWQKHAGMERDRSQQTCQKVRAETNTKY